ncbi:hypothetical protein DB354_13620 [Opitutus sp. ER46]|nr:hypothetical protein DB354_13620 [Opitutus sp. ER46]
MSFCPQLFLARRLQGFRARKWDDVRFRSADAIRILSKKMQRVAMSEASFVCLGLAGARPCGLLNELPDQGAFGGVAAGLTSGGTFHLDQKGQDESAAGILTS